MDGPFAKTTRTRQGRVRVMGLVLLAQFQPHTIITLWLYTHLHRFAGSRVCVGTRTRGLAKTQAMRTHEGRVRVDSLVH